MNQRTIAPSVDRHGVRIRTSGSQERTRWLRLLSAVVITSVICASLATASRATVAAQVVPFAGLDLPGLDVTVSATGYEGIPEEIEAGRYLIRLTAGEDLEGLVSLAFAKPDGLSGADFVAAAAGPPDDAGAGASPELETESSGDEEIGGPPPEFFFTSTYAGGTSVALGESTEMVLDLSPGEWLGWNDGDPDSKQEPVFFTVTGEMPADLAEPDSDATITLAEYNIEVTEGELTAGSQVVRITNVGAQPHFAVLLRGPENMTDADIEALFAFAMTGTPPAVDFDPETDLEFLGGTASQSRATDLWITMDLQPGPTHSSASSRTWPTACPTPTTACTTLWW